MGIDLKARESYHPTLSSDGTKFTGGERNYQGRLEIIESEVDFAGKRVLDLGCSGGFFTFSIAKKAKSVTAVDGDFQIIERNRELVRKSGYSNINFVCERITPEFLATLGQYDVVLFLSVFHHMVANSGTYDWNDASDENEIQKILKTIRELADVYVFEMGRPSESFQWSGAVGARIGEPRKWVPKHVFGPTYETVRILEGAAYQELPFRWIPQLAGFGSGSRLGRKLSRMMGIDQRDFREIYIGRRRDS